VTPRIRQEDGGMVRARLNFPVLIGIACLAAGGARAADYPQPVYVPVIEEYSSWYLRGDIGITNQRVDDLTNIQDVNNSVRNIGLGFDASPLFGIGVGYNFNDWLRFDVTGEYRSKANFHGTQVIRSGGGTITDEYTASKSEWLFLLNGYVDLGTWNGFTPFVGAGVGFSRNTISSFQDVNTPRLGVAFGDDASKWNFAWALHGGLAYKVTKNFTVELAYRYVDLGDAVSGDLYTYLGGNAIVNPMEFHRLTSHDIKLGVRFNFDGFESFSRPAQYYAPPPPVYQPPPPQYYQPAPVYQPPLRSRG
jgi:opacity protein-like surface antigen